MISGGGTGGHIFPAIAIAEALRSQHPHVQIQFVGTKYGMETELVPKAGYPLLTLPIRGFLGKGLTSKLALLWRIPASLLLSVVLLLKYRPKIVIGVGGYASGPLLFMAALFRIPTLIQEQNAFPGVTNRLTSRVVDLALCGFAEAARHLKCPVIQTGNPVRGIFGRSEPWSNTRRTLLILGGSQGARALNRLLPQLLGQVMANHPELKIVHQCGARYVDEVKAAYANIPVTVEVTPFIQDMEAAMNQALVMICRSGASTIAELLQTRVPAVLVPFPAATHDHQTHNAKSLVNAGAALLIPEAELEQSIPILSKLLADHQNLATMAAAYPVIRANSAQTCANIATDLMNGKEVDQLVKIYRT